MPDWLGKPVAVFLIDILLAGDNAVAIAMVALLLPPRGRRLVLLCGAGGAVVLRVLLAALAGGMLSLPGLKLVGGVLLLFLAVNLARPMAEEDAILPMPDRRGGMAAAVLLVVLVDVLMSLDNVLALAAVAGDSMLYLGLGLLMSVTLLMCGSAAVARLLGRYPDLARYGAALLGGVAGDMLLGDVLWRDWVSAQAPALPLLVPALAAGYVFFGAAAAPVRGAARERDGAAVPARVAAVPVVVAPVVVAPVVVAPVEDDAAAESEGGAADRVALLLFGALFLLAGGALAAFVVIGGGMNE